MNIAVIGSCLSNLTIARAPQQFEFNQTHCIHHNRSDAFVRYFVERTSNMIPMSFFDTLLQYKSETEKDARLILSNQYPELGGYFTFEDRRPAAPYDFAEDFAATKVDLVLLDNYMDVATKLMRNTRHPQFTESPLFLNPGFFLNEDEINEQFSWWGDYLQPEESAENQVKICKWVRSLHPSATIVFLCYQSCSSRSDHARYTRIGNFHSELTMAARGEDLLIVPPLEVADALTKGSIDWPHFQDHFYIGIAGLVYLLSNSSLSQKLSARGVVVGNNS